MLSASFLEQDGRLQQQGGVLPPARIAYRALRWRDCVQQNSAYEYFADFELGSSVGSDILDYVSVAVTPLCSHLAAI